MKTRFFIITALFCSLFCPFNRSFAQDIKNLDVKSMSSSQIDQAKQALQNSGLTREQIIAEARKKGATDAQIQQMLSRMGEGKTKTTADTTQASKDASSYRLQDSLEMNNQLKQNKEKDIKKEKLPPPDSVNFGTYLFNSKNLTFEPVLNIQTPKKYEINNGDEMIINIWGNSVQNYQLTVDRNGQVQIPQIGPVYVAGKTFEDVTRMIKQRLTAIYSGMAGAEPNTFAQVNMGRLRSIRVNLVGEVEMPGTYTLPATASVFNALYLSGGPSEIGSFRTIKIYRDNELYRTLDIYEFLLNADQKDNIVLKNDDVVFVPVAQNRVRVKGEFKRKAVYELKEGENLEDLVRYAGGFTDEAYQLNVKIYRKTQAGMKIMDVSPTNLNKTPLFNGDLLIAQKILPDFKNRVIIAGSVFRPGEYEWNENLHLSELIIRADNIVPNAMVDMGQMTRVNPDSTLSLISFNVSDVMHGKNDILLEPKDSIMIKSNFELKDKPIVTIDGQIRKGGPFNFMENMSVLDVIYKAGGFTEDADSNYVQISRRLSYKEAASLTDKMVDVFTIPIPRILNANDQSNSFKLKPYDHIYVRRAPGYSDHGSVYIGGEVVYSGFYAIQNKKDRISDLVKWSGGMTPDAYTEAASFTKVDAGPVGIDLTKIMTNPGNRIDLVLSPGDSLMIPKKPQTVNVFGEVQNPFATVFAPGKSIIYYIKCSGGWGEHPDKGRIYVKYPNGSSDMTRTFIFRRYPTVRAGSHIIVPKQPERVAHPEKAQFWLALGSSAATLAITVITIVNLLKL